MKGEGFYYHHWENSWYWSREQRGPWHVLPEKPTAFENEKRDRGDERERERGGPYRYQP